MKRYLDAIARNDKFFIGAAIGITAAVSFVAGYRIAEKKYEEIVEKEIADFKMYYGDFVKEQLTAKFNDTMKDELDLGETIIKRNNYSQVSEDVETPAVAETRNVFEEHGDTPDVWDQAAEEASRKPDRPYILSKEEFYLDDSGLEQVNLTFYSDGVLADDTDAIIPDINATVGDDNIVRFGHGSEDDKVLYIRNPKMAVEYEITLDTGKYAHIVMGLEEEESALKHSHRPAVRKFRTLD